MLRVCLFLLIVAGLSAPTLASWPTPLALQAGLLPSSEPIALPAGVPVRQANLIEETGVGGEVNAAHGLVRWSLRPKATPAAQPQSVAIVAEVAFPGHRGDARLMLMQNTDPSMPAALVAGLRFLPDSALAPAVDKVPGILAKATEHDQGILIKGASSKVAPNLFLIGFSDVTTPTYDLRALWTGDSWIDIPFVYSGGRRGLLSLEKPVGEPAIDEAFAAWKPTPAPTQEH